MDREAPSPDFITHRTSVEDGAADDGAAAVGAVDDGGAVRV